jgi:hypothetical protein
MKQRLCGALAALVWIMGCGSDGGSGVSTGGMTTAGNAAGPAMSAAGTTSGAAGNSAVAGTRAASGAADATAAGMTAVEAGGAGSAAAAGASGATTTTSGGGTGGAAGGSLTAAGGGAAAGRGAAGSSGAAAGSSGGSAGCGSESFAAIYSSILMNTTYNCTGPVCHGRTEAMAASVGNLSLSSAAVAYTQLVKKVSDGSACAGKTRVVPGDPSGSLFVQKLRGTTTMCGGSMPVNADELTDAELKRITDWISGGACNN